MLRAQAGRRRWVLRQAASCCFCYLVRRFRQSALVSLSRWARGPGGGGLGRRRAQRRPGICPWCILDLSVKANLPSAQPGLPGVCEFHGGSIVLIRSASMAFRSVVSMNHSLTDRSASAAVRIR